MQTTVLQFPARQDGESAGSRLSEILHESAYLLEASRESPDPDVRDAAIDLAIRSLKAAGMALAPVERTAPKQAPGRIVQGPWARAQSSSS